MSPTFFDVIVVGGGLVGGTLAACLARDPSMKIAIIEKFPPQRMNDENLMHPSYDARNTALANGTCHVFDQLGIWKTIRQQSAAIERIVVCDRGGFGRSIIDAADENVRALGYVIENRWVGEVLNRHLDTLSNVELLTPAEVSGIEYIDEETIAVTATVGSTSIGAPTTTITAYTPLLVVADGAQSATRNLLGIDSQLNDYKQTAIVTTITPDQPHNNQAWERFTETGPLALLPQTDNRIGITWCLDNDKAASLMAASDEEFLMALQKVAGNGAGNFVNVGQRFAYPLTLTLSQEQVRPNVVVLGNSAHAMHPVAGQGLNLSVRDVAALTQLIYQAREEGCHYGNITWLNRYFERRKMDQMATVQFSDKVVKLFSTTKSSAVMARNAGLLAFDLLPGAKRFLAHYAMGRAASTQLPPVSELSEVQ